MKKIILITGASKGLGKVVYDTLSQHGEYKVYGTSRKPKDSQLLKLDITDIQSVMTCVHDIIKIEGRIDVLINNVGSNLIGSLEGTTLEEYQSEMESNFYGSVRMIQEVLPYFRKSHSGRIINISSLGGCISLPFNSTYSSSKAALEAMSESLSYELADTGIYVSVVAPLGLKIENDAPNIKYINNEKKWHKQSFVMYKKMKTVVKPNVTKITVAKSIERIIEKSHPKLKYNIGTGSRMISLLHELLPFKIFKHIIKKSMS